MNNQSEHIRLAMRRARENWFPEHKGTYKMLVPHDSGGQRLPDEPIWTLSWRRPDRGDYAVTYVLMPHGVLHVSGDIGCATYWLNNAGRSFDDIARLDAQYFLEKYAGLDNQKPVIGKGRDERLSDRGIGHLVGIQMAVEQHHALLTAHAG